MNTTDNDTLKKVFTQAHEKLVNDVDLDSVIDKLVSKGILSDEDYRSLRKVQDAINRRRDLLSLLYGSSKPNTFVHFREALGNKYDEIVKEIDKQLASSTAQLQQTTDGKFLLAACNFMG